MKIANISLAIYPLLLGATLLSCNSTTGKATIAKEAVAKETQELQDAQRDYAAELESFRLEGIQKIDDNKLAIADFNTRIEKEKAEVRDKYKKDIAELDQKNSDLKLKIESFQAESLESWDNFKTEFNRDLSNLGTAFADLTKDNGDSE